MDKMRSILLSGFPLERKLAGQLAEHSVDSKGGCMVGLLVGLRALSRVYLRGMKKAESKGNCSDR
jgi:hypothetical protein